jgi:hypothetical protein
MIYYFKLLWAWLFGVKETTQHICPNCKNDIGTACLVCKGGSDIPIPCECETCKPTQHKSNILPFTKPSIDNLLGHERRKA